MIVTLTEQQMLSTWRLGARLEPALAGCSFERFDALDVDSVLRRAMRDWYLALLAEADPAKVRVADITDRVTLAPAGTRRWRLDPAADVVRITGVAVAGQPCRLPVLDETRPADAPAIDALANRFRRRGPTPLVVVDTDRRWFLTGGTTDTVPAITVTGVTDPGDEIFVLDESALADIPRAAREALDLLDI